MLPIDSTIQQKIDDGEYHLLKHAFGQASLGARVYPLRAQAFNIQDETITGIQAIDDIRFFKSNSEANASFLAIVFQNGVKRQHPIVFNAEKFAIDLNDVNRYGVY